MAQRSHATETSGTHLLAAVRELAPTEGIHRLAMDGLFAFRAEAPTEPMVAEYRLSICFVVQGQKRVRFGDQVIDYGGMNCLLVGLPLPLQAQVLRASPEEPCFAMVVEIAPSMVHATTEAMGQAGGEDTRPRAVGLLPIEGALRDIATRIARAGTSQAESRILGPGLKQELVYRVLMTEQAGHLRALASGGGGAHRIQGLIRHLNENLSARISIAEMAGIAHMSESALHQAFKGVTSMSPLQYLKRMRLQRARNLIEDRDLNASEAAHEVGYRSASQFSREFKALHGFPPSRVLRG